MSRSSSWLFAISVLVAIVGVSGIAMTAVGQRKQRVRTGKAASVLIVAAAVLVLVAMLLHDGGIGN